ncbi:hypothetical protein FQZ97_972510 [compost metagenome]
MHDDGNVRVHLDRGLDHLAQEGFTRVLARTGAGLQDHRRVARVGRLHDGLDLLQVVHVERGHAVVVFGGVVEQLSQSDEGHGGSLGGRVGQIRRAEKSAITRSGLQASMGSPML